MAGRVAANGGFLNRSYRQLALKFWTVLPPKLLRLATSGPKPQRGSLGRTLYEPGARPANTYWPFPSVTTRPSELPARTTEIPAAGRPIWSTTRPEIVRAA